LFFLRSVAVPDYYLRWVCGGLRGVSFPFMTSYRFADVVIVVQHLPCSYWNVSLVKKKFSAAAFLPPTVQAVKDDRGRGGMALRLVFCWALDILRAAFHAPELALVPRLRLPRATWRGISRSRMVECDQHHLPTISIFKLSDARRHSFTVGWV